MIITTEVETRWNNFTKDHYEKLGYVFTKINDRFTVKVKDLLPNSVVKVYVKCDYCGQEKWLTYRDYIKSTENNTQKYACSKCGSLKMDDVYHEQNRDIYYQKIVEACEQRGYILLTQRDEYKNSKTEIKYLCPIHGLKTTKYRDFINQGSGCQECGYISGRNKLKLDSTKVSEIVSSKNNDILLNPEDYINHNISNLRVLCGSCGNEFTTSLSAIINGSGNCRSCGIKKCADAIRYSPDEVEEIINSVNGNILTNKEDYVSSHTNNLIIRCSCGEIFTTSLANYMHNETNRCRKCSGRISKGELRIMRFLDTHQISYIPEYTFDDCYYKKLLPFDFYLVKYGWCIEFDGYQHFYPVYGQDYLKLTQKRDSIKTKYCQDNNIKLIRIPYYEYQNIETILTNELQL